MNDTPFPTDPDTTLPLPATPAPAPTDDACIERVEKNLAAAQWAEALVARELAKDRAAIDLTLSIAIPVYNEAGTIGEIVRKIQQVPVEQELLIVDDGSTDGTREILAQLQREPGIRVFLHPFNQGKGAALRTAMQHATGDVLLIQDADLEYDPADYLKLLAPIASGEADVVYGSRFLGDEPCDPSRLHRWGNALLTRTSNFFTGQQLTDMETCYKVFRRSAIEGVEIEQNRFGFEPEITAKITRRGYRIAEVPIGYHARGYRDGKKIGLKDAFSALYCIVRYGWA